MHDFNAGVRPSGLFWIAQVPDSALIIMGETVRVRVENVPVVDNLFFMGPGNTAATVSFDVTWTAFGKMRQIRPTSSDPTSPLDWAGEFRFAM